MTDLRRVRGLVGKSAAGTVAPQNPHICRSSGLTLPRVFGNKACKLKRYLYLGLLLGSLCWGRVAAEVVRDPEVLRLASVSAAVYKLGAEEPVYLKRGDWIMPIASLTKLMTALVVVESGAALDEWLPVVKRNYAAPANAYSRIRLGSEATRRDLLHLALMSSENRAAYLLARHHQEGYAEFIQAMNDKARQLGMTHSTFVDSTGLSDSNVSTARDLVKLANAAFAHPIIRELSSSPGYWAQFRKPRYGLQYGNTNPLVHSERWGVSLSKTGYLTASGRCLVMVANVNGETQVIVLLDSLGTRSPIGDAGRIRRWLETGVGSTVAGAASAYERDKSAARQLDVGQAGKSRIRPKTEPLTPL